MGCDGGADSDGEFSDGGEEFCRATASPGTRRVKRSAKWTECFTANPALNYRRIITPSQALLMWLLGIFGFLVTAAKDTKYLAQDALFLLGLFLFACRGFGGFGVRGSARIRRGGGGYS